jgi:hypothetical protein
MGQAKARMRAGLKDRSMVGQMVQVMVVEIQ